MKAVRFHEIGGPAVVDDIPQPRPSPQSVLVRNEAMGVNFGDLLVLRGQYMVRPPLPAILGMEAAGTIVEVGPDAGDLQPGMRVGYISLGAFAEYSVVRHNRIFPLPDFISIEQAGTTLIASLTAYHLLHTIHRIRQGETVVVHSAAGGVGMMAVQLAKVSGARVIALVSAEAKAAAPAAAGADHVIVAPDRNFAGTVLDLTAGRGADLILDGVGEATLESGLRCLAAFGHLILFGRASGSPPPLQLYRLLEKSQTISGFALPNLYRDRSLIRNSLEIIFSLTREGALKLPIGGIWPLAQGPQALDALNSGTTTGKLMLR